MIKIFHTRPEAYTFFKTLKGTAILRSVSEIPHAGHYVFTPASEAIGHPTTPLQPRPA